MTTRRRAIVGTACVGACVLVGGWLTTTTDWWPGFVALSLFGTFVLFRWRAAIATMGTGFILVVAVAIRVAVLPVPPMLSDDVYRFVWDAHVQEEGRNVYANKPNDSVFDETSIPQVRASLNSGDYYSVYPPVSQLSFRLAVWVAGSQSNRAIYAIKALFVLAEILGLFLLARLCTPSALALYALNPLVVVETAAQVHTEALAIPLIAASILAVRSRRPSFTSANGSRGTPDARAARRQMWGRAFLSGMGVGGATMIKLYPALWIPALVRRAGLAAIAGFLLVVGVTALPFYAPGVLDNIRESLDLYVRLFEFNAGPYYLLKGAMRISTGEDWSKQLGPLLQHSFLVAFAGFTLADWFGRGIVRSWLQTLTLERIMFWTLAAFLATATTIHPWYFVPLIALLAIDGTRSSAWIWLAAWSTATYLFYSHGVYWSVVWVGWGGWLLLLLWPVVSRGFAQLMRLRSSRKARLVLPFVPHLPDATLLDLGCGEGYVSEAIRDVARVDVLLMDVVDYHRGDGRFVLYDGVRIPLSDDAVDVVLLYFVLHHAEDPDAVIREAFRVARSRVIVVESTFRSAFEKDLLAALDRAANWIRSGGAMRDQPADFRSSAAWASVLGSNGATLIASSEFGRSPHRQVLYVYEK